LDTATKPSIEITGLNHDAVGVAVTDAVGDREAVCVGVTLLAAAASTHTTRAAAARLQVDIRENTIATKETPG